MNFKVSHCRN